MKKASNAVMFLAFLIINACTYENESDLISLCDTTNIDYQTKVKPIFDNNCTKCHNAILLTAGFNISDTVMLREKINSGKLKGVTNHLPGFSKMPLGEPQLPNCSLTILNIWMENGAPF